MPNVIVDLLHKVFLSEERKTSSAVLTCVVG